ncbi:MAG: pyruvate ferredoxin oxidoreductase [Candidatus Infernicultor aquiphilus]|uniref:Pyruvate ferredoxin oxidoreductase n=1 Tax=Candidatus Infernicultor aquiphilus TaxID=1805029 RepID=A0A2M7KAJ8_9BACT|nr:MAG: pyruvate ferredoxin oxidoreductase [Candidatus Atribacteria bacterium CG08_land_8_20_14_0_20_33_29]PIW12007.1 MAG: pyruvate ferredoxin oxidoreductase [Candidatus Atribacteria bacterium CG17_big_fil_post_rev_8_21_14_2_50_34_11]PIX35163.1 MAG: pyruvate ferredoxin oxidoreductase [Candidatus Atribacteria bacterium CG_4_8_14_3_um_filter_34_18]PIY32154.1 MAG: pyruvate ferredoxin oxidoreductase [Candidatus Atribacteria bacterium CG_4_10_14_3_um_filter_34_13]
MANLKELSKKEEILSGGHRLCAGCGASIVVRQVLSALDDPVVVANATGCLEVATTIYPYTSWKSSFIHNAFENAAATISGTEAMFKSLKRQGKIDKEIKFIAFGGDGGTYDIGLQSLSGALERGHNFVYVCYDNEGYMNTGIQRSSATPRGAWTTTTPAGKVIPGKAQYHKNLTEIVAAHNIPYVAQANPWRWNDLIEKARKAFYTDGPAFINVLSPCPRGWRFDSKDTVKISKLAVQTNFWPLYEVENGVWKLNYRPKERKPIKEWMEAQGRYRHLFRSENEHIIKEIQEEIDKNWEKLLVKCGEK